MNRKHGMKREEERHAVNEIRDEEREHSRKCYTVCVSESNLYAIWYQGNVRVMINTNKNNRMLMLLRRMICFLYSEELLGRICDDFATSPVNAFLQWKKRGRRKKMLIVMNVEREDFFLLDLHDL